MKTTLTRKKSVVKTVEAEIEQKILEKNQKQLLSIFQNAPAAISVYKGSEYKYILANKAYEKLTNRKAEDLLGKSFYEVFSELKGTGTFELFDNIFKNRESFTDPEYAAIVDIKNDGVLKQCYFNFSMEPLKNDLGEIYAIIAMTYDITEQVVTRKKIEENEKQHSFLLNLTDALRPLGNPVDIEEAVTKITRDFIDADWCLYANIEGDKLIILRDAVREDLSSVVGEYQISNFSLFKTILDAGHPFIVNDVRTTDIFDEELKQLCEQLQNISFINVPVIKNGKPVGLFSVVQSKPRKWTELEVQLTIETAERTWAAVERAKVEEALRKSEEKYRNLFTSIDQGFAFCELVRNTEGKGIDYYVLEVNPTYEKQSGVSIDMVRGKTILQAFPTIDRKHINTYAAVVDNQYPAVFEQYFEVNQRWFDIKVYPGDKDKFTVLFSDITERKLFEKQLIEAKVLAENATKSKQQFLSNMSHEIRTPLNSILGFTNVLLKTELGEEQKEFLQAIKTSGKSLNLLIDDILDLAKVDAGKMTFEKQPFEIQQSITSILHSFDLKIKEKNLKLIKEFDSNIPAMLLGDSLRLNQIFLNLLSNAVKFTHKGKITLNVKLLSETEDNVTLEFVVTDTGIGIADNKLNSIFNLFEQAELSTSNSYGGTGLGLAIVKHLVEAQGGSITIKSKLGEGSTFSFIMPFGKTNIKLKEEIEIVKLDSEIKNQRVLVAEDVALNQLLIKIILSDFGFEYEIVENGKLAIEKLQTNTYDIVLMDLQMPEMNGFEATEYIRKTMKSQIPIIALTADVTTADVSKCKECGMDDYISKPIDEKLLHNKIVGLVIKS